MARETRLRPDVLALLREVSAVAASLELEETLAAITRAATGLVAADAAVLFLFEKGGLRERSRHGEAGSQWAAELRVPIRRGRRELGTLTACRRRDEPFDGDARGLLEILADQAAVALDHAVTYRELSNARARLQALLDSTDVIWRTLPLAETAELAAAQVPRLLPGTDCVIGVLTRHRRDLLQVVAATAGYPPLTAGRILSLSDAEVRLGAGFRTGRMVPLQAGEASEARTWLGLIGYHRTGRDDFSAEERELQDEFAKRVSLVLQRADLLDAARETADRLETALNVAADVSATLDPAEVMRTVIVRATQASRADRGVLLRVEGEWTVVEDYHDVTGAPDMIGYRHPIETQPLMRRAISSRAPVIGGRYDVDALDEPLSAALFAVRHTATIPLVVDERVEAVLVLSRREDRPFEPGDLSLLSLIGNQAVLALRNARLFAQAKAVSRAQSDFLNMAAHELRTPLSVISGYISLMAEGALGSVPGGWQRPLETLSGKVMELETLISELLVASRLEAGRLPVALTGVDLREAVFASVDRAAPRVELLGARLRTSFPSGAVLAMADFDHTVRILDNLLNNALSYSQGAPQVSISVRASPPRVVVSDRGPGIPPELRQRIFERFFRVEDPERSHAAGTGLGLYISRELAERMGGELVLERSGPAGSRFVLRLQPA